MCSLYEMNVLWGVACPCACSVSVLLSTEEIVLIMSVTDEWNGTDRGIPKYSEENLTQCHFLHHKCHID
jgi:hypothetical protein